MISMTGLDDWKFLEGTWKARSAEENTFGEEGYVEGEHVFKVDLGGKFVTGRERSYQGEREIHTALSVLFYDEEESLLRRKTFFSYGFVNNEVEIERDGSMVRFEIVMEPVPEFFKGTKWRSYLRKVSDDTVLDGLESYKDGINYSLFGETILKRVK
jgi:hypothetical protein